MSIKPTYVSIPFEEWEEYQKMKNQPEEEFKLEVGKDYVAKKKEGLIIIDREGDWYNVGFLNGAFSYHMPCLTPELWRKATEEEVIEAFEKECVRRLGENWRDIEIKESMVHGNNFEGWSFVPRIVKTNDGWQVWGRNGCLYSNGKWAEKLEVTKFAESLEEVDRPWYLCTYGQIRKVFEKEDQDKNHVPTEELAEGLLALIQLLSFRHDVWDKEGKPKEGEDNWIIYEIEDGGLIVTDVRHIVDVFKFKKKETAEWFLETHKELLTEYFNKLIK